MGTEAPDPKTLASWEEAFHYPIPVVRGMEKQLRRDIDLNREKLRTLVGASYRDLLGTAESIISMDSQMHQVEGYIGELGRRCNTRILEKMGSNLRDWKDAIEAPNSARYVLASNLAVLRSCPDVLSKLLKDGGSVLLAAKVLVILRLLHTHLSQRANPTPYLETLRNRLGNLRRKLLSRIDRRFKSLNISRDVLVEAMCAFALATSSSAKDVLRHYHHIRQEAISESMSESGVKHENTLLALRLYARTLQDTQAVIPNQLAHALDKLKTTPLLKGQDVYSLMELNLDVHKRWIGEDIKTFTPYVRHDDLSKAEVERSVSQWVKQTFSSFLIGLRERLCNEQDPHALMELRRQIFELWLSNHQPSIGIDIAESLDQLRGVFNLQATGIMQGRVSRLDHVGSFVNDVLHDWQPGVSDLIPSLWDPSMTSIEISNGGKVFRETLTARSLGKNGPIQRLSHQYMEFLASIEAIAETIRSLRETKWADDMDDVNEDEDILDNKQVLLSEDDPRLLQEELNNALHEAYANLELRLRKAQVNLHEKDSSRGQKSCFLIRIWREIRQQLPPSYQNPGLGRSSIFELQLIIASEVLLPPLRRCSKRLQKVGKSAGILPSRPLWEGDPELPVLPSPWTYRFLLYLSSSMTACGSDIWSPQATATLKKQVAIKMVPLLETALKREPEAINGVVKEVSDNVVDSPRNAEKGPSEVDGEDIGKNRETPDGEDSAGAATDAPAGSSIIHSTPHPSMPTGGLSTATKIQMVFDIAYLIKATATRELASEDNELISLQTRLIADLALDSQSTERIGKDAAEYWKRTSLLFGLLA